MPTDPLRTLASRLRLGALLAVLALVPTRAHAQQQGTAPAEPTHNLDAFEALDLRAPNEHRTASGAPAVGYWQQEADYQIDVSLDPAQHRVEGTATISYTNNAPEALSYLWVQLEQNVFKPDSRGARITPGSARFSGAFEGGGYDITAVTLAQGGESAREADYLIEDTRMRVALPEPLEGDGGEAELSIDFAFTIPEYGADRMGRLEVEDGTIYQLAQWYPRMYVYDDVSGWNALPYLGQGEFYLEYGQFDLNITVPREMIVVATGELLNPDEVLTDEQRERLDEARTSRETVMIVSQDEVGQPDTRPDGDGPLTWRYRAENVRDVAWAASEAFIWDAAQARTGGARDALAMSVYPDEGLSGGGPDGWEKSTEFTQHSIEFYSDFIAPYPYPVAINVAGVVGGMEYPQIVFCSVKARARRLFGVTDHEFGHEWFPMIVGSDERRWAWMDEGLNSFINIYSTAAYYGDDLSETFQQYTGLATRVMPSGQIDQPIMTYADRIRRPALGWLAYRKPATGLMLLREYVVGPELFDSAFKDYFQRWAYKHPKPADFFRTMEEGTGEDLDYFWRGWFYERATLDHAIARVDSTDDGVPFVTLENRGELMMPATLQITYRDGTAEELRVPVEGFFTTDTIQIGLSRPADRIVLDPAGLLPDVDRANNVWTKGDASSGSGSGTSSSSQDDR